MHVKEHEVYLEQSKNSNRRGTRTTPFAQSQPVPVRNTRTVANSEDENWKPFTQANVVTRDNKKKEEVNVAVENTNPNKSKSKTKNRRVQLPMVSQTWETKAKTQRHCDTLWTLFLASAGLNPRITESQPTNLLLRNILPRYNIRKGEYYVQNTLPIVFDNLKNVISNIAKQATSEVGPLHLSIGKLEGERGHFLVVSLHYVNSEFVYHNIVLGVKELSNYDNPEVLKTAIVNILAEFDGVGEHPKQILYDMADEHLARAISDLSAVISTKDCIVPRLDRAVRNGMALSQIGTDLHETIYAFVLILINNHLLLTELKQICKEIEGKHKVSH